VNDKANNKGWVAYIWWQDDYIQIGGTFFGSDGTASLNGFVDFKTGQFSINGQIVFKFDAPSSKGEDKKTTEPPKTEPTQPSTPGQVFELKDGTLYKTDTGLSDSGDTDDSDIDKANAIAKLNDNVNNQTKAEKPDGKTKVANNGKSTGEQNTSQDDIILDKTSESKFRIQVSGESGNHYSFEVYKTGRSADGRFSVYSNVLDMSVGNIGDTFNQNAIQPMSFRDYELGKSQPFYTNQALNPTNGFYIVPNNYWDSKYTGSDDLEKISAGTPIRQ
jgi:hypothetical protein